MKRLLTGAAVVVMLALLGTVGAEAAEDTASGGPLRVKNKEWKNETFILRDGRVYGKPEALALGGRWKITEENGGYFVSVPVDDGEDRASVRLPVGKDGLADFSFFGDQAGMNFKLNERKMEIKFEKLKPVKKKKGRDDAGKKAKTGEVLLVWDPDIDFDPDKPFFNGKDKEIRRIISPGWGTYDGLNSGKRYYPVDYIEKAQQAGLLVMPMINNDFDPETTSDFLKDQKKQEQLRHQMAAYTEVYGLDGWNIDFENMDPGDARRFTSFVADTAELLHEMGKVVSVDITAIGDPNSYWSGCYDRKGLAEHVDYAVLMGYDQTSGGSDRAGPVSSYNWLDRILPPLLKEIPAEQLILGLPFYTRVWTGDDGRASSDVLTLEYTEDFARRHKIMPRWQDTERQFYADWRENGVRKRVWLEEDRSLAEKAGLVKKYGLGGAAFWRYGFESPDVYNALDKVL